MKMFSKPPMGREPLHSECLMGPVRWLFHLVSFLPSHRPTERACSQRPPACPICPVSSSVRNRSHSHNSYALVRPSVRPSVRPFEMKAMPPTTAPFGGDRRSLAPFDDAARPRRCSLACSVSPVRPPSGRAQDGEGRGERVNE